MGEFLILLALMAVVGISGWLYVLTKKNSAFHENKSSIDLFSGFVQMVFWEPYEGIVFMRDKAVTNVEQGDGTSGGYRYVFPFLGQSWKGPVPTRRIVTPLERQGVKTRESVPVDLELALEWQITDCREFLFEMDDRDTRRLPPQAIPPQATSVARGDKGFYGQVAAEMRLRSLAADTVRRLVAYSATAWIIAPDAAESFAANTQQPGMPTPDGSNIGAWILQELSTKVEHAQFGVELLSVNVENIRLPSDLQNKIVEARTALHQGQITQTEISTLTDLLGVSQVRLERILQNLPPGLFQPLQGLPAQQVNFVSASPGSPGVSPQMGLPPQSPFLTAGGATPQSSTVSGAASPHTPASPQPPPQPGSSGASSSPPKAAANRRPTQTPGAPKMPKPPPPPTKRGKHA